MQKGANFNDAAIAFVKGNYYRSHFLYKSKDKALNIMKKSDLKAKSGGL